VNKSIEITATNRDIKNKLYELYEELLGHDGYGDLHLEVRILRRRQKEVIISCGKQYRYVVSYSDKSARDPGKARELGASHGCCEDQRKTADRRQNTGHYRGVDRRKTSRRTGDDPDA
jgi:hypothetical protein